MTDPARRPSGWCRRRPAPSNWPRSVRSPSGTTSDRGGSRPRFVGARMMATPLAPAPEVPSMGRRRDDGGAAGALGSGGLARTVAGGSQPGAQGMREGAAVTRSGQGSSLAAEVPHVRAGSGTERQRRKRARPRRAITTRHRIATSWRVHRRPLRRGPEIPSRRADRRVEADHDTDGTEQSPPLPSTVDGSCGSSKPFGTPTPRGPAGRTPPSWSTSTSSAAPPPCTWARCHRRERRI